MVSLYTKKIMPCYFHAILDGKKRFEIRKEDDFFAFCGYTGRWIMVKIVYIHRGEPLPPGIAVYQIEIVGIGDK